MDDFEKAKHWFLQGLASFQNHNYSEAERLFKQSLGLLPDRVSTLANLSATQIKLGNLDEAKRNAQKVVSLDPGNVEGWFNLGWICASQHLSKEALSHFNCAIQLRPDYAEAYSNRGKVLGDLRRFDEAFADQDAAIKMSPGFVEAHMNRGNILREMKRFDEALSDFDEATRLNPNSPEAFSNRGNILSDLNRLTEALVSYDRAIALEPRLAEVFMNRGNILVKLKRIDDAIASYERAIALKPDYWEAHRNLSFALLTIGNFENGWQLYEQRLKDPTKAIPAFEQPQWLGDDDLSSKKILVHCEQGLGDSIQFCRYISLLNDMGAEVLFATQPVLATLMRGLKADFEIVDAEDSELDFDFHSPLMSLPLAFKTDADSVPDQVPYLDADPDLVERWAERLGPEGFKIGICWQGHAGKIDAGRSFPLQQFSDISSIPNVRLISLHKGAGEAQLDNLPQTMRIETLGPDFDARADAFVDTAAVVTLCDLIITSDTAVAHLAGALGAPTWVVLKQIPDWRWMLDRPDSLWYPTMRLFRQTRDGDWNQVFAQLRSEVTRLLAPA